MKMIAFYLPRGHSLDYLLNLTYEESMFYYASMQNYWNDEKRKYNELFGEGK